MSRLKLRDIVIASFPESDPQGHEQVGTRPAVVLGLPRSLGKPRFDLVLLAPMTTAKTQSWAKRSPKLYPVLESGAGGLPAPSLVLLDQVRCLDSEQIGRHVGTLTTEQYAPILESVKAMLEIE